MADSFVRIVGLLVKLNNKAMLADGFEDALIGVGKRGKKYVAVYDIEKCIKILRNRDGMNEEDAREYFDFNVMGSYVGLSTPTFSYRGEVKLVQEIS